MLAEKEDGYPHSVILANGISMPLVGLGTYKMNHSNLEIALPAALDAGYRSFDTAASYRNEKFIGDIFARELSKRGLTRQDIFITTKLKPADQGYDEALAALRQSATLLGGYIDLYLIHWPGTAKVKPSDDENRIRRAETWRALQDVYTLHHKLVSRSNINHSGNVNSDSTMAEGGGGACSTTPGHDSSAHVSTTNTLSVLSELSDTEVKLQAYLNGVYVRAIGVSNFNIGHIESLVAAPHFQLYPHVNQCELHPAYHPHDLRTYCLQHSIHLQAYSSLGCGKLLEKSFLERFPQLHHMARKRIASFLTSTETFSSATDELMETVNNNSDEEEKRRIAARVKEEAEAAAMKTCTVGVYLRWALQHGYSIIPKSCNPQRIHDNYAMAWAGEFLLSQEEMDYLNSFVANSACEKFFWDGSTVC